MLTGNKGKLVEAATELFHSRGFRAAGLEDILAASGVCKSNFYYHFKSKEQLALQVLEQKIRQAEEAVIAPTIGNPALSSRDRIVRFFESMVEFCTGEGLQKGCIFGNMTLELTDEHEEMRGRIGDFFAYLERRIASTLEEGIAAGEFAGSGLPPNEQATAMVALLQGSILLAKGKRRDEPLRTGLNTLLQWLGEGNR